MAPQPTSEAVVPRRVGPLLRMQAPMNCACVMRERLHPFHGPHREQDLHFARPQLLAAMPFRIDFQRVITRPEFKPRWLLVPAILGVAGFCCLSRARSSTKTPTLPDSVALM